METAILFLAAGLAYAVSFGIAFTGKPDTGRIRVSFHVALGGFAAHTAAMALRICEIGGMPVGTSYDLLESIAWMFVLVQLLCAGVFRLNLVGIFSMLPAAVLTLLPLGCPLFIKSLEGPARQSAQFAGTHAALAVVSYAFIIGAAMMAAMYVWQKRSLQKKSNGRLAKMLPPLDALARGQITMTGGAAILMASSLAVGVLAAFHTETIGTMMYLKFAVGATVFVMVGILYLCAATEKLGGSRLAWNTIGMAAAALLLLIPIELGTILK